MVLDILKRWFGLKALAITQTSKKLLHDLDGMNSFRKECVVIRGGCHVCDLGRYTQSCYATTTMYFFVI